MTIVMRQEGEINLFLLVLFFKIDIFCAFIASKYILNDAHCNCILNNAFALCIFQYVFVIEYRELECFGKNLSMHFDKLCNAPTLSGAVLPFILLAFFRIPVPWPLDRSSSFLLFLHQLGVL